MSIHFGRRVAAFVTITCCALAGQALLAGPAAAVTIVSGELKGGQLRIQGSGNPGTFIIASSTTSTAGARADQTGRFKIERSDFTAPDCTVTVSDGDRTPTATVSLAGCTPTVTPVPDTPAEPTGSCVINATEPATFTAGVSSVFDFDSTGCNTTFNSGASPTPVEYAVVAGSIPTGMTGPVTQGNTGGNLIGTPTVPGTYRFTLQVTDHVGATDQENVTITVV